MGFVLRILNIKENIFIGMRKQSLKGRWILDGRLSVLIKNSREELAVPQLGKDRQAIAFMLIIANANVLHIFALNAMFSMLERIIYDFIANLQSRHSY